MLRSSIDRSNLLDFLTDLAMAPAKSKVDLTILHKANTLERVQLTKGVFTNLWYIASHETVARM
jgi:hypothetical protein